MQETKPPLHKGAHYGSHAEPLVRGDGTEGFFHVQTGSETPLNVSHWVLFVVLQEHL